MSPSSSLSSTLLGSLIGFVAGLYIAHRLFRSDDSTSQQDEYSIANQTERHALALKTNNSRVLDIDKHYDPSYAKGKIVLVTGILSLFVSLLDYVQ